MKTPAQKYYLRRFGGGRTAAARILDYAALRLILFFAAYLLFRSRIDNVRVCLLLACMTLALCMLILRAAREILFERFLVRERERLRREALLKRLLHAPASVAESAFRPLMHTGETMRLLFTAERASANLLLSAVRFERFLPSSDGKTQADQALCVVSLAGFTQSAVSLAAELHAVRLIPVSSLVSAAEKAGVSLSAAETDAYAASLWQAAQTRRKRSFSFAFPQNAGAKYLFAAAVLSLCAFLTRYALYYRMLSGLCVSLAAVCFLSARLTKTAPEPQ